MSRFSQSCQEIKKRHPNGVPVLALAAAAIVIAAVVVAVVIAAVAAAQAVVAAAAEQDEQNDDPAAVTAKETVITHKEYLQIVFSRLSRSFHGIPET